MFTREVFHFHLVLKRLRNRSLWKPVLPEGWESWWNCIVFYCIELFWPFCKFQADECRVGKRSNQFVAEAHNFFLDKCRKFNFFDQAKEILTPKREIQNLRLKLRNESHKNAILERKLFIPPLVCWLAPVYRVLSSVVWSELRFYKCNKWLPQATTTWGWKESWASHF